MDSFNLTTQPWIPCEFMDGQRAELSTRDALVEAHRVRTIADPSPLVLAVLHRHLLAVLHRAYVGPTTMNEWCVIARSGRFEADHVERYLSGVRDRMDLFHPTHPFAQTRGLVQQFAADPIDALTLERSSWGSARELFQHRPVAHHPSMEPAQATRALLAHQAFATGGLVKKPNEPTSATAAPLVRAAVVLLRGASLFETLVANLLVYDPAQNRPIVASQDDAPAWERGALPERMPVTQEPKRLPTGWLDVLTWVSRRIELVGEDHQVLHFVRCVGQGLAEGCDLDPMVSYRLDEKRGFLSIGIDPEKAFWRNADSLFEGGRSDGKKFRRPMTLDQMASPEALDVVGTSTVYTIGMFGLSAEKSRIDYTRAEQLAAAVGLFADPDAREAIEHALRFAEAAVRCLWAALSTFARESLPRAGSDGREQREQRQDFVRSLGAQPAAWSALGAAFEAFVLGLSGDKDDARRRFEERTRQVVRKQFYEAVSSAMADGRTMKARALAETEFERTLTYLVDTESLAAGKETMQEAET